MMIQPRCSHIASPGRMPVPARGCQPPAAPGGYRSARRRPHDRQRLPAAGPRGSTRARLWLTALAHVRASAADDDLYDRAAAHRARLTLPAVHEEAVLKGAARTVYVAEVVDRRALGLDPRRQRLLD